MLRLISRAYADSLRHRIPTAHGGPKRYAHKLIDNTQKDKVKDSAAFAHAALQISIYPHIAYPELSPRRVVAQKYICTQHHLLSTHFSKYRRLSC